MTQAEASTMEGGVAEGNGVAGPVSTEPRQNISPGSQGNGRATPATSSAGGRTGTSMASDQSEDEGYVFFSGQAAFELLHSGRVVRSS
eukprot:scaffold488050_cov33-Prasinocladus_malaysianus.AAC.1